MCNSFALNIDNNDNKNYNTFTFLKSFMVADNRRQKFEAGAAEVARQEKIAAEANSVQKTITDDSNDSRREYAHMLKMSEWDMWDGSVKVDEPSASADSRTGPSANPVSVASSVEETIEDSADWNGGNMQHLKKVP